MPRRLVRVDPAPIRSKQVCVRLTPREYEAALALAERTGRGNVAELLRDCLHMAQMQEAIKETVHARA
jgi:hypothetical protein